LESDPSVIPQYNYWSQILICLLFFFASIFLNVLFFNTLITVIGQEYSDHWDNKMRYGLLETARLFADHMDYCSPRIPDGPYLYVVSPATETSFEDQSTDFQSTMLAQVQEFKAAQD
jgi:hypothetical protein